VAIPEALHQSWSIDFMHDALLYGRHFRTFNAVDDINRGYPLKRRMNNGPEFISLTLAE